MAGDLSRAFQQDVLEAVFGKYSTLAPSTMWVHLYNSTLSDASTPATTGRCAGSNYDPVKIANTTGSWTQATAAGPSVTQNKSTLTFTTSASTGWGTINAALVSSSSGTGGFAYLWGDLSTAAVVASGNTVQFSTAALSATLT